LIYYLFKVYFKIFFCQFFGYGIFIFSSDLKLFNSKKSLPYYSQAIIFQIFSTFSNFFIFSTFLIFQFHPKITSLKPKLHFVCFIQFSDYFFKIYQRFQIFFIFSTFLIFKFHPKITSLKPKLHFVCFIQFSDYFFKIFQRFQIFLFFNFFNLSISGNIKFRINSKILNNFFNIIVYIKAFWKKSGA